MTRMVCKHLNNRITGYAKIIGSLKEYNNRVSLTIHSILPVLSMDEVTAHYLSTISCYLYYKKKTNTSSTAVTGEATAASNGAEYGSSLSDTESKVEAERACEVDLQCSPGESREWRRRNVGGRHREDAGGAGRQSRGSAFPCGPNGSEHGDLRE